MACGVGKSSTEKDVQEQAYEEIPENLTIPKYTGPDVEYETIS